MSIFIQPIFSCWISNIQRTRICAMMYTDAGISGTGTAHRSGFTQMVQDALAGKFSLIVTKSISRWARNTVDSLTTIRKLKEHGCEVFFEKE